MGVQFAVRLGLRVAVISRGEEKEALARKLGAQIYIDSNKKNAADELMKMGGARAIFCTAPNSKAISELVGGLAETAN